MAVGAVRAGRANESQFHAGLRSVGYLQRRARAARERLTSDFDWQTVAKETAQVYVAAKRRERQPQPRLPIVEHALPDR